MDGDISEIANVLFEKQCESQIIGHREKWSNQKSIFTIWKKLIATLLYRYLQGYIIDIDNALGCVHDVDLNYNVGNEIQGLVKEYDEKNMWILISKA